MKRAGITVVRVGESTWTSWEPREGEFQFAWMDRVVDAMHAAGIKVVMGTPTYSIPPWLYAKHPEIMVVPLGQVRTPREFYGMRQNMDITHPVYRQYCERVIRKIAERYGKHPGVIGWQIDNETGAYGTAGPNVQAGFKEWLKRKFGTVEALNEAWGLVYWGQLVGSWDELPPRDGILNPGWKLEWERYQRSLVTDFLGWQAGLVREYAQPRQWVTQDFHGATRTAVDSPEISKFLDVAAINPYHATQDDLDGWWISVHGRLHALDEARALPRHRDERADDRLGREGPVPALRRPAPPPGLGARGERRPHGRVLALALAALRPGDVLEGPARPRPRAEPGLRGGDAHRRRAEAPRPRARGHDAEEPRRHPPQRRLATGACSSCRSGGGRDERGRDKADYTSVEDQLHKALYDLNVGADFVFAEEPDFAGYDVLLVPPLYVASDALLQKIADFAKGGGHVLLDPQERLHERIRHRALDAGARAAPRGGRDLVSGVLEPQAADPR